MDDAGDYTERMPNFGLLLCSSPAFAGLCTSPKRLSEANVIGISILIKIMVRRLEMGVGNYTTGGDGGGGGGR
jgi:hypothetical protein